MDEDLLGCFLNGGGDLAFDELAAFEAGAGTDEGNEVGRGDGTPAGLGGLDQLERQPSTPGTCPAWTTSKSGRTVCTSTSAWRTSGCACWS
jgi:hypothetical protein